MGKAAAADELVQLHARLGQSVPELRQVEALLQASLGLSHTTEVAPLLQQRLQQCGAAIVVLSLPLAVAPGREAEDLATLRSMEAFVADAVNTLREHKVRWPPACLPGRRPRSRRAM